MYARPRRTPIGRPDPISRVCLRSPTSTPPTAAPMRPPPTRSRFTRTGTAAAEVRRGRRCGRSNPRQRRRRRGRQQRARWRRWRWGGWQQRAPTLRLRRRLLRHEGGRRGRGQDKVRQAVEASDRGRRRRRREAERTLNEEVVDVARRKIDAPWLGRGSADREGRLAH